MSAQTEAKESTSSKIVSGVAWSYISAITSGVLHLAVLAILAHLLSPREFGLLGIALIFINFSERLAQIGLGPALVQREQVTPRHCLAAAHAGVLTGLVLFAALWYAAPYFALYFREPEVTSILRALGAVFVLEGFAIVPDSMLQRGLHFRKLMIAENVAYFIGSGAVSIVLAWRGFGVWALVDGMIVMRLVRVLLLNRMHPQPFRIEFCLRETRDLLSIGFGFSLGRLLNFCALYGDNFIVGRVLGAAALGMYSRAYQLMTLPSLYFAQILDRVLFPALAQHQNDSKRIRMAFLQTLEFVSYVAMPVMVAMVLLADEIVVVLLGPQWQEVIPVLQVLSLGVFVRTGYKVGDILSRALGAVYQLAFRQGVYTVLVVAGALFGAAANGLEGVAWGVLLAVTANYVLMLCLGVRLIRVSLLDLWKAHVPSLWIGAVMGCCMYASVHLLRAYFGVPFLTLAGSVFAGGVAAYAAAAMAPRPCRLASADWLLAHIPLQRLGKMGALGTFVLRRQLPLG